MKIGITGAAGFLGNSLIKKLIEIGEKDLVCFDIVDIPEGPYERKKVNLAEKEIIDELKDVDIVFHCASIHPWKKYTDAQYLDYNIKGTWNLYKSCCEFGIKKVVLTSSIAVNGYTFPPEKWPVKENIITTPCDLYSLTKQVQETIADHFAVYKDIQTIALRPCGFIPKDDITTGFLLLKHYLLIEDLVDAHISALYCKKEIKKFEAFIIANKLPYTKKDKNLTGWELPEKYFPGVKEFFEKKGFKEFSLPVLFSTNKAKKILGWQPKYNFDWWWKNRKY